MNHDNTLRSNSNKASTGCRYGSGIMGVDMELMHKAEAIMWYWCMYSFLTVHRQWCVCSIPSAHVYAGHVLHADSGFRSRTWVWVWVQAQDSEIGWTWLQQVGCHADSAFASGIW